MSTEILNAEKFNNSDKKLSKNDERFETQAGGKEDKEHLSLLSLASFRSADAFNSIRAMTSIGLSEGARQMLAGYSLTAEPIEKIVTAGQTEIRPESEPRVIDPSRFALVGKEILAKLDPENKGLSKERLARAVEDPSFKGYKAQVLAAMYDRYQELSSIRKPKVEGSRPVEIAFFLKHANDPIEPLSAKDLDEYERIRPQQEQLLADSLAMTKWANKNFARYFNSQQLSREDLKGALDNKDTPERDQKILKLVQDNFEKISRDGISLKKGDFESYYASLASGGLSQLVFRMESLCERTATEAQTPGESYALYATADPLKSIKPDGVRQGSTGDCYFDAALAAVARVHPEFIRDAIKDNDNGTYTVTFPGAPAGAGAVTVKAPTETELGLYNGASSGDGTWAAVIEKAFGEFRREHPELNFVSAEGSYEPTEPGPGTPQEGAAGGGFAGPCLKLLTGHESDALHLRTTSRDEMEKRLEEAFSKDHMKSITAEVRADLDSRTHVGGGITIDGFPKQHMYSVIDYVPSGKDGAYVVVRNPWAGKMGTVNGTITISLDKFMKNFDVVTMER